MQHPINIDGTAQQQDLAIRREQASLRRAADQALRAAPPFCSRIAPDTAQLLSPILSQEDEICARKELLGDNQHQHSREGDRP